MVLHELSLVQACSLMLPGRELGRVGNVFRHDLHVEFEVAPPRKCTGRALFAIADLFTFDPIQVCASRARLVNVRAASAVVAFGACSANAIVRGPDGTVGTWRTGNGAMKLSLERADVPESMRYS